ncbi:MAG TPA: TetR/AcrR family transcriptional regulator [Solirubrobacteraceae bacterium]|nr:TetR/AcrR family transcriptional regulator [Solirubrobacteraceae bacterium]
MESQEEPPIPASLAAAWGRRERPSRGPKPGLSLERIVEAAVRVASGEGLAAVSMARVAQELGTSTMSLYRYVAAKDELLMLMVDAALGPPPPTAPEEGWRDALSRWAWSQHERMRRHPWVVRVPISGPPTTPNQLAWMESVLWSLRGTGLAEDEKASVLLLLSGYVRNEATLTAELMAAGFISDEAMMTYSRLIATLTDPERFPALHALLEAGVFDRADPPEKEFGFGLQRVFDGIEALISSHAPGSEADRRPRPTS